MRMLYTAALSVGILMPIGCEKSSSTAPSTNPGKPEEVRELLVVIPLGSQSIVQDKTNEVLVTVTRKHFKDEVKLDVTDLPSGVTLETKDLTIPADGNTKTLILKAAPDAKTVIEHTMHIVAKAKDIPEVKTPMKLTVKAK